ncbi:hypothetical protein GOP47_0017701 [Adiantum capillus-veneris]|uniref:Uncharacterized protein n=1 Tax=Adiantum capillus-veneris TaxID=13818 RepID=A0A9D4UGR0_ADICA|nr:hypothetical protein GOP47_0017701 [Adiantum capillus-veneris]
MRREKQVPNRRWWVSRERKEGGNVGERCQFVKELGKQVTACPSYEESWAVSPGWPTIIIYIFCPALVPPTLHLLPPPALPLDQLIPHKIAEVNGKK